MSWIDIDDVIPNQYEDVLIFDDNGNIQIAEVLIDGDNHFINNCCDGTKITHWQLLPQPPEE